MVPKKLLEHRNTLRLVYLAWDFWGLIFGPGIFWGFVGSPRDFAWVLILDSKIECYQYVTVSHMDSGLHCNLVTVSINYMYFSFTVEPRFNEPLYNEVLGITNDIFQPSQSYSKMHGTEP